MEIANSSGLTRFLRATPKNGFHRSLLQLAIGIRSARFSNSSLLSPLVCLLARFHHLQAANAHGSTVGPRFALVFLWYTLTARPNAVLPKVVAGIGIFRTLTCGGWTYVTSTDDHGWHDIFMISYLVATLPWTLGCIALSSKANQKALNYRKILAGSFFGTLVPLIYFFIQHKVHKIAGGLKFRNPPNYR